MHQRMIFIGLGGSGGKTIRFLKREIRRWLKQMNWEGDMPMGWQFLHIDTPTAQDGTSVDVDMLPDGEYLGLVGPGVGFPGIVRMLDGIPDAEIEMEGWRVAPAALGVPVGQGAGQFRAVGRTIALAYLDQISTRLRNVIGKVNDATAATELKGLSGAVGDDGTTNAKDPLVVVISSLAGGTGAGLFMDVCDLLREMAPPWGDNSFALLYTPEVFDRLGGGATGGVQPNSLAAISELINGHWLHGGVPGESAVESRNSVFHTAAGSPSPVGRSGPAFPLLIGRTGGAAGISFGTDIEVFEMVGRALMSWATDPVIQDDFLTYEIGNWPTAVDANQVKSSSDVIANAGSSANPKEAGGPLFSSLGFARVSLGNTYFEEYSERRLGFDAARWAVEAVRLSSNAVQHLRADASLTDSEVAERVASDYLEWFLRDSNLHERGPQENDVLQALFPGDIWHAAATRAEQRALDLTGIVDSATASDWQQALIPAIRDTQHFFYDEVRPAVDDKIRVWINGIQQSVITTVEKAIATHGLHVAGALLDATMVEMAAPNEGVAFELLGEAAEAESYGQNWEGQVRAALGQTPGKLGVQHPAVQTALTEAIRYATQNLYGYLIRSASILLEHLSRGFLRPLRNGISGAIVNLEAEMDHLSQWPRWDGTTVPASLTPPRSEITLLKPSEFPRRFEDYLAQTVGGAVTAAGTHRQTARLQILSGSEVRKQLNQTDADTTQLVVLTSVDLAQAWWPGNMLHQDGMAPSSATFHVRFEPKDLLSRASHWLNRTGTSFHEIFDASLANYTAPDTLDSTTNPAIYRERQERFLECFATARAQSTPLVRLNPDLLSHLHPLKGTQIRVSTVPFGGHPLEEAVRNELEALFDKSADPQKLAASAMSADRDVTYIDIMSMLEAPVSPLVVESLMGPISAAWQAASPSFVGRGAFWTHRRARPLSEFIPLPAEHQLAAIRGFFTSRMLGLLNHGGDAVTIRTPDGRIAEFPNPMLRPWTDSKDLLPALLESLPLAMVDVQRVGTVAPLEAYNALRDYGWQSSSDKGSQIQEYTKPAQVIATWLESGEVDGLRPLIVPLRDLDSIDERRKAMVSFLISTEHSYQDAYDEYRRVTHETKRRLSQPPEWPGIWPIISQALQQLAVAVRDSTNGDVDDATM